MSKRDFVEDKIYLKTPDGQIWEYEPLLAKQRGVTKVIPNRSKKKEETPADTGSDTGGTQTKTGNPEDNK